jgi:protocatechuate 3,4-dioxygenase beta subunit
MEKRVQPVSGKIVRAFHIPVGRRRFFKSMAAVSAGFALPGYLAEALTISPQVTQGPYYPTPDTMPLDKDNDLLHISDSLNRAIGKITYLTGRVLTSSGAPIKGALLELWHADNGGIYVYQKNTSNSFDSNFQGFGQCITGEGGYYKFRTIKAGLYNGRTRHFHLAVTIPGVYSYGGSSRYCTQLFWNETAYVTDSNGNDTTTAWSQQNSNDMVYEGITDSSQRAAVTLTYSAVDPTAGAVAANFDFVLGYTPIEPVYPSGGFVVTGDSVAGPTNSTRFKISIPAYTNYTYEVYGNPSLLYGGSGLTNWDSSSLTKMGWAALPFSLAQTGVINTNKFTATSNSSINVYLQEKAVKGFYFVTFRAPGENIGTP